MVALAYNLPPPEDGIEILVKMAQTGQIDPWNLDIVAVADQYLRAISELQETDLKRTGKTLLYLAILLRMKSDQLAGIDFLSPLEDATWEDFGEEPPSDALMLVDPFPLKPRFHSLEEVIKRRTSTKQPRIRRVTLEDLILELKRYEELEKKRALREKVEQVNQRRRMADYSQFTSEDIEELAHEEFIEDTIFQLRQILERLLIHAESIPMAELFQSGVQDPVSVFIALLFLEVQGVVEMVQEAFYGEVHIRRAPPPPEQPLSAETGDDTMAMD